MRYFFPLLFIVPYVLMAQGTDIELGITGGTTIYVGDLSGSLSEYSTKDLGYTAGIFLRNNFNKHIGYRFGLSFSHLKADELNRRVPNTRALNFNNDLLRLFYKYISHKYIIFYSVWNNITFLTIPFSIDIAF